MGLDALGMGIAVLPPGVRDFAGEVRVHGDNFTPGGPGVTPRPSSPPPGPELRN